MIESTSDVDILSRSPCPVEAGVLADSRAPVGANALCMSCGAARAMRSATRDAASLVSGVGENAFPEVAAEGVVLGPGPRSAEA